MACKPNQACPVVTDSVTKYTKQVVSRFFVTISLLQTSLFGFSFYFTPQKLNISLNDRWKVIARINKFQLYLKSSIIFYILLEWQGTTDFWLRVIVSFWSYWMACTALLLHSSQVEHALTRTEMINQGGRMWLTPASCIAVRTPFLVITFDLENLDQTVRDIYLTTLPTGLPGWRDSIGSF